MVKEIELTKGKVALVDDADYEWLMRWSWHVTAQGYAAARGTRFMLMHREILKTPPGAFSDHIDGNKLNNCRSNLRICTPGQNTANKGKVWGSSKYKGVSWNTRRGKWYAHCYHLGESKYLGSFTDEKDAALAYDKAALELFGEFASINFPEVNHE